MRPWRSTAISKTFLDRSMAIVVGFSMDSSFSVLLRLDDVGTTMPFHVMKEESTSSFQRTRLRSPLNSISLGLERKAHAVNLTRPRHVVDKPKPFRGRLPHWLRLPGAGGDRLLHCASALHVGSTGRQGLSRNQRPASRGGQYLGSCPRRPSLCSTGGVHISRSRRRRPRVSAHAQSSPRGQHGAISANPPRSGHCNRLLRVLHLARASASCGPAFVTSTRPTRPNPSYLDSSPPSSTGGL